MRYALSAIALLVPSVLTMFASAADPATPPKKTTTQTPTPTPTKTSTQTPAETDAESSLNQAGPSIVWSRRLGRGRSRIAADEQSVYVTFLKPWSKEQMETEPPKRPHLEVVAALDRSDGTERWRYVHEAGYLDAQQTFGGGARSPQAAPLLIDSPTAGPLIVTLGFTGELTVLDRRSGRLRWRMSLVERFDATPVSFGFSAGPIEVDGRLIILAGGSEKSSRGGLVALDPDSGEVLWNVPCGEASYAAPVVGVFDGRRHIIFVTRNRVVAVTPDGEPAWQWPLENPGLTNVPTPLVTPDGVIISGQGVAATRRLRVTRSADSKTDTKVGDSAEGTAWNVEEVWRSREQFFYCNWMIDGDRILGCDGDLLLMIDISDGSTVGRWRGFAEGNLVRRGRRMWLVRGDGDLSLTDLGSPDSVDKPLVRRAAWELPGGRYWAAPTMFGGSAYVRFGSSVLKVALNEIPGAEPLVKSGDSRTLAVRSSRSPAVAVAPDPLTQILAKYRSAGPEAAVDLYEKIRQRDPRLMDLDCRKRLFALARQVGQNDLANRLPGDAFADLGDDASRRWVSQNAKVIAKGEAATEVGKNGLVYVRFGIVHFGPTIQAHVRGPAVHPFGYGLSLVPGRVRAENWPVGTRLTEASTGRLLVEVSAEQAGKLVTVP